MSSNHLYLNDILEKYGCAPGHQKISLHKFSEEFKSKAASPLPRSADLCFVIDGLLEEFTKHLNDANIRILLVPIACIGALGA